MPWKAITWRNEKTWDSVQSSYSSFYSLCSFYNSIPISCHKPNTDVCYVVFTIRCGYQACYVPTRSVFIVWCINSSAPVVSSSDQSHLNWPGPFTVHNRHVSSIISFFSLHNVTRQEDTNSYLDHALLDNKFATFSAGKNETSTHPLFILKDIPHKACTMCHIVLASHGTSFEYPARHPSCRMYHVVMF